MNIQIIFQTSDPADFASVLAHCMAQGIRPNVSAAPVTGNTVPAGINRADKSTSPAVSRFREKGMQRLRVGSEETPHSAALRRLTEAGVDTSDLPTEWEETETDEAEPVPVPTLPDSGEIEF